MPRQPRNFEINGIYHVVKRAIDGRAIFPKSQDSSRFILGLEFFNRQEHINIWDLVGRTKGVSDTPFALRLRRERGKTQKPIVELLSFALMPNHIHLIAKEITQNGISLFMQRLSGYSRYFNRQRKRVGPLFEQRFKAVRIKDDIQLSNTFVYVHTNPIALWEPGWKHFDVKDPEGAIQKLGEYRLSSYNDYMGHAMFPQVVKRDFFLNFYGSEARCRHAVEDWIRYKGKHTDFGPEIIE